MKTGIEKILEMRLSNLRDNAEIYVCQEIQKLCKLNKWTYKGVFSYRVYENFEKENEKELYNTEIDRLIRWYEDNFGSFVLCMCVRGKWIVGQTPLIDFEKPLIKKHKKKIINS